jgi:hypothetical protein
MLTRECSVFCKYLIGQEPNDYVIRKYREAHGLGSLSRDTDIKYFDEFLVWLAKTTPFLAKLVDTYSSKFHKRSLVRRKFILLVAILESAPPSCNYFDLVSVSNPADFIVKMCWKGTLYASSLLLSVITLMPLHLIIRLFVSSDRNTYG